MTRLLFKGLYLRPNSRLGRLYNLTADVQMAGTLPIRIAAYDAFVDRSGVAFDELPPEFRNAILAAVKASLQRQGVPVPDPLIDGG